MTPELWRHIHNISFSLEPMNGPNKLEYYITVGQIGLPVTNIGVRYWVVIKVRLLVTVRLILSSHLLCPFVSNKKNEAFWIWLLFREYAYRHSSLFCDSVNDNEKSVMHLSTGCHRGSGVSLTYLVLNGAETGFKLIKLFFFFVTRVRGK